MQGPIRPRSIGATTASSSPQTPSFSDLVGRFGLRAALDLMPLFDENSSTASKAFGSAKSVNEFMKMYIQGGGSLPAGLAPYLKNFGGTLGLAGGLYNAFDPNAPTGARILGGLNAGAGAAQLASNIPGQVGSAAGNVAQVAGPGLALAALGYNLANIAGNKDYSTEQKVGHSVDSAVATAIPVYGLSRAANAIFGEGGMMQRSGSPAVRDTGKAIAAPALPIERLLDVFRGDRSPRAAMNAGVQQMRDIPGMGKVLSPILDAFGLGTKPTAGTTFRTGLQGAFRQMGLPDFNRADPSLYNIDPAKLEAFSPDTRAAATTLADQITAKRPKYRDQTVAILLNTLGDDVVNHLARLNTPAPDQEKAMKDRQAVINASGPMAQARAFQGDPRLAKILAMPRTTRTLPGLGVRNG